MTKPTKTVDAFRFIRNVLDIQTETPAQKSVLVALALRANHRTGTCYPSYEVLCRDTGLARSVVARAIIYLRDKLQVLTWKRGHSNQYRRQADLYTLNAKVMSEFAEEGAKSAKRPQQKQSAESESLVAESELDVAESDSQPGESVSRTLTTHDNNYSNIQLRKKATGAGVESTSMSGQLARGPRYGISHTTVSPSDGLSAKVVEKHADSPIPQTASRLTTAAHDAKAREIAREIDREIEGIFLKLPQWLRTRINARNVNKTIEERLADAKAELANYQSQCAQALESGMQLDYYE
jgi:hypothetical protein